MRRFSSASTANADNFSLSREGRNPCRVRPLRVRFACAPLRCGPWPDGRLSAVVEPDFFVIEIVDQNGLSLFGTAVGEVVHAVGESVCGGIGGHFVLERLPVLRPAAVVDLLVQRHQLGVFLADVGQNCRLELPAQIEILEPDEVGELPDPLDDRLRIGDAREDRRDEADGADARLVDPLHGFEPPLDAHRAVHVGTERLVERVDRPRNRHARKFAQQVQVAQHEVRLRADHDLGRRAAKLLEQVARAPELLLEGVVAVGHRADDDPLAVEAVRIADGFPVLDVEKRTPRLGVARKTLHERGVTILAGVGTPHIGVDRIAAHGQR